MKLRSIRALTIFTAVNIFGILLFYMWVFSNQVSRLKKSSASKIVFSGGGAGDFRAAVTRSAVEHHRIQQFDLDALNRFENEKSNVLAGHTLKPSKKSHVSLVGIKPVPEVSESDDVRELDQSIMRQMQEYREKLAKDTILILSPIHDVAGKLKNFQRLLQSITYPNSLISIAFGEDSSSDNTLHAARNVALELRKSFSRVDVFHLNMSGQINGSWSTIHHSKNQLHRRGHLAEARNALLSAALKDQDWVLWIDSDVSFFPPDIVQQLLSAEKEIVAPLCVYQDGKRKRVFDKNTWRETPQSLVHLKHMLLNELMVEGYGQTKRLWLSDLRAEGRVVPIDGVGGCTLLIRSKCHKEGLVFPEELFQNHIETEGLAKLAKHMGFGVYGMPFVEVVH
ncbi:uncharacterized protein [Littorina saxatilis]|uniref:Uncharacterized protein n=1 Tax=Littorina saxatilis TaxID=31220 RepID=A0AAN9AIP8_9CAEN